MKQIGGLNLVNLLEAAEGFCLALFTRHLHMSVDEALAMVEEAKASLKDPRRRWVTKICVTYGRRPEGDGVPAMRGTGDGAIRARGLSAQRADSAYFSSAMRSTEDIAMGESAEGCADGRRGGHDRMDVD